MKLFKGYIKTRNKKAVEKFKDRTDLKSLEEVKDLPEYAGILGDETILIDIDNQRQAELMMNIVEKKQLNCRVYQTTRGKHFLFKNSGVDKNGNHKNLACGITADIKIGSKNSYSVLKFDDTERFIEWDIETDVEYQKLPKWLFPININTNFLEMKAGDGRNQALFNYILTLQSNDFTVEEVRETIRIINEFVLKVPLNDSEIEVILRDDAFNKPIFFKNKTFLFDKFATYIQNKHNIIKINNQLHIYKDGIYVNGQYEIEAEMIKNISNLNRVKRNEVISYLNLLIRENTQQSDANMIVFKNGVHNIISDEFLSFSREIIINNKINWNYNPTAYSSLVDETLNKIACNDKEVRMLLEEVIGYCMYRRNELGKAFILIGDKSNGKSTFLDMVKTMLGDENIASLDLGELGDRFKSAELFGKLANIGDDIGDEFITNASIFKKLVTGDRINVERKGQDPFEFNNYAKFLFSANNIPRIKDKAGAVQRRLVIIPFDAKFSINDPDYKPYIKYDLRKQECIEYMISLGIEGLKRVLVNQKFSDSKRVERELEEYEEENNPIIGFFKEIEIDEIKNEATDIVYKRYSVYCSENNYYAVSKIAFSKQVKKYYNFIITDKKIDGKKRRVFVDEE